VRCGVQELALNAIVKRHAHTGRARFSRSVSRPTLRGLAAFRALGFWHCSDLRRYPYLGLARSERSSSVLVNCYPGRWPRLLLGLSYSYDCK
jgi:hypothetical protein